MAITTPHAAVAILHAQGPEESVLLIRRQEHPEDPWSGHWSFPGGRCDPGDRDPLETALRELQEECGIRLERGQLRESLTLCSARGGSVPFLVAPFVFAVPAPVATQLDAREAVEARWAPIHMLRDRAQHRWQPVPGRPPAEQWPGISLGAVPLWGFTYRLICQWLEIEPPPR